MRHIGSLCKLIDYLKTVEFYTLKTSQCKKGNNADSKKYTSGVQCLHRWRIFNILKFNMNFQITITETNTVYLSQERVVLMHLDVQLTRAQSGVAAGRLIVNWRSSVRVPVCWWYPTAVNALPYTLGLRDPICSTLLTQAMKSHD